LLEAGGRGEKNCEVGLFSLLEDAIALALMLVLDSLDSFFLVNDGKLYLGTPVLGSYVIQSDGFEVCLAGGDCGGVEISSSVIEVDVLDKSQSSEVLETQGEISDISVSRLVLMGWGVLSVDML
jgi:hypothetical protein